MKGALLTLLCLILVFMTEAQYENYSFIHFPQEELMPLTTAYGLALDNYAAENWTESIKYLELSLRLYRLLKDSVRYCTRHCKITKQDEPPCAGSQGLCVSWHVMKRALCQTKCRAHFPALQLPLPGRNIQEDFDRRSPYRYLHFAYFRLGDLQRAVPCAYTFLQRNPEDQDMLQLMEQYKKQYDLSGYLIDQEERPYEASFLRGVTLISSGDYSSSVKHLEEALRLYLHEYELCQVDCEGLSQLVSDRDFYAVIAGMLITSVLNDGCSAVPCAYSYFLLEPEDQVMKQNLLYYKAYGEQWGIHSDHFTPRMEALQHHNQTVTQKQMLKFAEKYLQLGDEDCLGPEEAALLAPKSPDIEFEGQGDYEESFYDKWRQPKGKGDAGESDI
uniref:Leprecan-like alpha-helical domain-containing protein n=1 Tax=Monopterus albus TaxID=43700 RepID=A0A3Q3KQD1_MONAL